MPLRLPAVFVMLLAASVAARAAQGHPEPARKPQPKSASMTLEQAVAEVQNETGGKVLKADSRSLGRVTEYRIKVLTPDGHVRVVSIRSDTHGARNDKEKR